MQSKYQGTCVGGPWHGEWRESDMPLIFHYPPMSVDPWVDEGITRTSDRTTYRHDKGFYIRTPLEHIEYHFWICDLPEARELYKQFRDLIKIGRPAIVTRL